MLFLNESRQNIQESARTKTRVTANRGFRWTEVPTSRRYTDCIIIIIIIIKILYNMDNVYVEKSKFAPFYMLNIFK